MALVPSVRDTMLDAAFPVSAATDYIAYSADGATESSALARTAVGATGWNAATSASPAVKSNKNALTSAAATGAVTVAYVAIFSAATAGTQRTDWTALGTSHTLAVGDVVTWAAGSITVSLS